MKKIFCNIFLIFSLNCSAENLPQGWMKTGSDPSGYDAGVISDLGLNPPVAYLKSNDKTNKAGFATVMQQFFPEKYLGKRVEMTVMIKSESVDGWAGGWLRIDGSASKTIAFDNMERRPVKGSTDWKKYSIVLDVSEKAESLNYGVLLSGQGQVWFDDFVFKEVSDSVAVTDTYEKIFLRKEPINNGF